MQMRDRGDTRNALRWPDKSVLSDANQKSGVAFPDWILPLMFFSARTQLFFVMKFKLQKPEQMDSEILIKSSTTGGGQSTLNLFNAYQKVMTHLEILERDWNSVAHLKSSVSTWKLLNILDTAVCQIPFHPRDYVPKKRLDRGDPSARAAIRQNFEDAEDPRFYLQKNLLEIRNDSLDDFDQKQGREKIELIKTYVQKHIDRLKSD